MRFNLEVLSSFFLLLAAVLTPAQSVVSTIAGGAATGPGDGGAASLAFLNKPTGVTCLATYENGLLTAQTLMPCTMIIVDQADQRIRQVTTNGIISTLAGTGVSGFQNGAGPQAQFNFPEYAKADAKGNIYVTEVIGHRVRMISPSGNVSTLAGTGTDGDSGDGCGPSGGAAVATFHQLYGVAISAGGVYVSDSQADRVRLITTSGPSAGCISTILGNGTSGFAGDGTASATLNGPQGLAYNAATDTLYVADTGNNRIRMLTHAASGGGIVSTFAGCGAPGSSGCTSVIASTPTTATASPLYNPQDVAIGPDGVYILDVVQATATQFISLVYRVNTSTGTMTPLYSLGTSNGFLGSSLNVISQTQIYVAETLYTRTIQSLNGNASSSETYAGGGTLDGAMAVNAGVIGPISSCPFSGSVTCEPAGIKADSLGNIYISDFGENRVRKISPSGVITTVAGNGVLEIPAAGAASPGDGGSAVFASLAGPLGLDFDAAGNLYIAEAFSNKVRMVSAATGVISTFAGTGAATQCSATCPGDGGQATSAGLFNPTSVAVNRNTGAVYIVDNGNDRIRVVNSAGVISTYAGSALGSLCNNGVSLSCGDGGKATAAELAGPVDIVLDAAGNLYIAERFVQISVATAYAGSRIRKVTASSGLITTIAGNGNFDTDGEGSAALSASLGTPSGLAIDPNSGHLFVSDDRNQRILEVTSTVNRVVGDGSSGFNGDGYPGTSTEIQRPQGLALDPGGNLLFWDTGNNRVRKFPGVGLANPETMLASGGNNQTVNVGQVLPKNISVVVLNGSAPVSGVLVQFSVSPAGAATLSSSSVTTDSTGTASTQVTVGSAAGAFTITASATGLPVVTFNESALATVNGITNGAGFAVMPLAPGTISSLFGQGMASTTDSASGTPLPTTLATNTSVSIIGSTKTLMAPLFYVSPTQINFQLPFEVTDATVNVVVNTGASSASPLSLNIASFSPGIFTINAAGQGAILHASTYALVTASNPANVGEVVLIYCTGLGAVNPPLASGTATPNGTLYNATTPTVSIGGSNAVVSFAGLAPGFVGLYQINAVIPNLAAGSVPVIVTAGSVTSNTAMMQVN